jgi:hypothetical protein
LYLSERQSRSIKLVHPATSAVHGDLDFGGGQHSAERSAAGELTALVGIG